MVDLPGDVLHKIGSLLLAKDRVSFRSVCTEWRSALPLLPPPQTLTKSLESTENLTVFPVLMYDGLNTAIRSFYHPIHNTTYVVDMPEVTDCRTLYSKYGWLLMLRGGTTEIFFFNPTTRKIIALPDRDEIITRYTAASFSSVPTSSDCVVFCVLWSDSYQKLTFIRRGEREWTDYTKEDEKTGLGFIGSCSNPVFRNGVFYYLDVKGCLGTFDPTKEECENDGEDIWTEFEKPKQPCNSLFTNYLVDCEGDLISVFVGRFGKWIKIFKLEANTMWKKVEKLGDNALFISQTTSLSVSTSNTEIKGMGNNIFFPRFWGEDGCSSENSTVFYSLDTGKFHSLGTGFSSDDLYGTTLKLSCTWLSPVNSDNFLDDNEFCW